MFYLFSSSCRSRRLLLLWNNMEVLLFTVVQPDWVGAVCLNFLKLPRKVDLMESEKEFKYLAGLDGKRGKYS